MQLGVAQARARPVENEILSHALGLKSTADAKINHQRPIATRALVERESLLDATTRVHVPLGDTVAPVLYAFPVNHDIGRGGGANVINTTIGGQLHVPLGLRIAHRYLDAPSTEGGTQALPRVVGMVQARLAGILHDLVGATLDGFLQTGRQVGDRQRVALLWPGRAGRAPR